MKALLKYFKERRRERLRKWCVDRAIKSNVPGKEFTWTVGWIYKWIKDDSI